MRPKSLITALGLACLQWLSSAHAQTSDTLQKIKSSGVIQLDRKSVV